ncbi:MAG: M23 family metallopeptidase [Candidatus Saccharimonadales bacterium]
MLFRTCFLIYKLRFVYGGVLVIIAALFVIAAAAPHSGAMQASDAATSMDALGVSDSPNAVTAAMTTAAYKVSVSLDATARATGNAVNAVALVVSRTRGFVTRGVWHGTVAASRGVQHGAVLVLHGTLHVAAMVLRGIGSSILFVLRIPGNVLGFIAQASVVGAVIRPPDHNQVPIIDPNSPALVAAKQALPAVQASELPAEAIWPLHGKITTEFGVPELPYQAKHTGLDITDGNYKGTTPIMAFRRGRVVDVETKGGLGYHVVVDHGSGVTSVYGHLASIAVQVGQTVDINTVLGYEGSTGVSTGAHLHFEIRVNGQVTDPHQFISGQP